MFLGFRSIHWFPSVHKGDLPVGSAALRGESWPSASCPLNEAFDTVGDVGFNRDWGICSKLGSRKSRLCNRSDLLS